MTNPFKIFGIKKEERWLMLFVLLFLLGLHALLINKYYGIFTPITKFYWPLFIRNFHVSGFDPITYSVVSDWTSGYDIHRHPLLAFFMYPAYLVNQGLMALTGKNCALFVVAAMQTFWGFYAMVFFYRIVREVIELSRGLATILTLFFLSFAYVMLSCMVPDHFVISMMLLLLALYISGKRMKDGREFSIWQTVLYFFLTAGVTLSNGLMVFLCGLFVNRKRFFRPAYLLLAVIIPALSIWTIHEKAYQKFVHPTEVKRHQASAKRKAEQKKKTFQMQIRQKQEDSLLLAKGDTATYNARIQDRKREAHKKAEAQKKRGPRQGAPITKKGFLRWTDVTTSRWDASVENLFGESIQLHQDHLLGDVMRNRPMVVRYRWWVNYGVEAIIVLLFFAGLWYGRRNRFLWLVLSFFGINMAIHMGLGFGINEVYIMSAHWIYVIPFSIAYLLKSLRGKWQLINGLLLIITCFLMAYNTTLALQYFI